MSPPPPEERPAPASSPPAARNQRGLQPRRPQAAAPPPHKEDVDPLPGHQGPWWAFLGDWLAGLDLAGIAMGRSAAAFALSEYGIGPLCDFSVGAGEPWAAQPQPQGGRSQAAPPGRRGGPDPWSSWASQRQGHRGRGGPPDPRSEYQGARPHPGGGSRGFGMARQAGGGPLGDLSREEFISRHVDAGQHEQVRKLGLNDRELAQLGRKTHREQAEYLQGLGRREGAPNGGPSSERALPAGDGKPAADAAAPATEDRDRAPWEDDDWEEHLFWWQGDEESLCFDCELTPVEQLTDGAPQVNQWWDVEALAQSSSFAAVMKPAGMFVVTSPRGLWEVSPTNFIHVAHQRIDIPSREEPRQRGICHRLDSHTSGVQIFGKTWDALRHFVTQNASHRVQKEYIALVDGRLGGAGDECEGVIDVPMKKWQDFSRREFGSVTCAHDGMPAVTKYRVLRRWLVPARGMTRFWGRERWLTLVQVRILTGRTHQIRVHMAFIGHPLVADSKYAADNYELDCAIVPRIFLHSLRTEFEDTDGKPFRAVSDLAPDLQVALARIQELALAGAENRDAEPTNIGFPGLARLLELTQGAAVPACSCPAGAAEAFAPRVLVQKCPCCGEPEESRQSMVQRGDRVAMYIHHGKCKRVEGAKPAAEGDPPGDQPAPPAAACSPAVPTWGQGVMWKPELLRRGEQFDAVASDDLGGDAEREELGEDWGPHGAEWAWAHDGVRNNGWIRLHAGGGLSCKWGPGRWALFPGPSGPPLLLATFNGVEHGLRLGTEGGNGPECVYFDMVSRRRLGPQEGVQKDPGGAGELFARGLKPCCPTRGWPSSGAAR